MKGWIFFLAGFLGVMMTGPGFAQSLLGYQGVIKVPSAFTTPDGRIVLGYGQVPGSTSLFKRLGSNVNHQKNEIYFVNIGFLPFIEISGGIVRYDFHTMGVGDRTFAIRCLLLKESKYYPQLTIGVHDPFSAYATRMSQNLTTSYLVTSKTMQLFKYSQLYLHLGYSNDLFEADQYLLLGWFYATELRIYDYVTFLAEYDTEMYNYGIRLHYRTLSVLLTWLDEGQSSWQVAYQIKLQ